MLSNQISTIIPGQFLSSHAIGLSSLLFLVVMNCSLELKSMLWIYGQS